VRGRRARLRDGKEAGREETAAREKSTLERRRGGQLRGGSSVREERAPAASRQQRAKRAHLRGEKDEEPRARAGEVAGGAEAEDMDEDRGRDGKKRRAIRRRGG